ncbi:hypothetical protein ACFWNG_22665 [Streptomyces sp. NPDC058391]|uniref:hypothetical protein n=1 Tax=Streptomyces sp. NPDC058391 TaxID=3346476 RepID=UPI0036468BB2
MADIRQRGRCATEDQSVDIREVRHVRAFSERRAAAHAVRITWSGRELRTRYGRLSGDRIH